MSESEVDRVTLEGVYVVSDDVVAREIEGEVVIVPLAAGVGDADDELYTLNDTAIAVWRRLDGQRSLRDVVALVCDEFEVRPDEAAEDVLGLVGELARRGIVVRVPGA